MKILYLYHGDVFDRNNMSGTVRNIYDMLVGLGHEVEIIDNLYTPISLRIIKKIKRTLLHKQAVGLNMDRIMIKVYALQFKHRIRNIDYDFIFSPVSVYYAHFVSSKPTAFFIDSNVACLRNYYLKDEDFTRHQIEVGYELETMALKNCDLPIYASKWATGAAVSELEGDCRKIKNINRGANVVHKFSELEYRDIILSRNIVQKNGKCELLFIGKEWERKGGNLACEITRLLNVAGIDAKLTVIGSEPNISEEYKSIVEVVGFLNKNDPDEYDRLEEHFKKSDFFIMPTRIEAQGISYIEACSWAVPPIGCNTGGVSDVVIEGVTGLLFELEDKPEKYVERILSFYNHPDQYIQLANSSRKYCLENMTWAAVGKRIDSEMKRIISNKDKK